MKELPYFKFEPAEWIIGDISFQDYEVKGLFIDVCCFYWMKLGAIDKQMLSKRYSNVKQMIDILISENILKVDENNKIIIDFLDAQLTGFKQISELRSKAGKLGVIGKQANAKQMLSKSQTNGNIIEEKRREEKREEKKRKKNINTPNKLDVISYFLEKGYTEESAIKCFDYYDSNNWHDVNGKKVQNWKQKAISVWFKPENKKPEVKQPVFVA